MAHVSILVKDYVFISLNIYIDLLTGGDPRFVFTVRHNFTLKHLLTWEMTKKNSTNYSEGLDDSTIPASPC